MSGCARHVISASASHMGPSRSSEPCALAAEIESSTILHTDSSGSLTHTSWATASPRAVSRCAVRSAVSIALLAGA